MTLERFTLLRSELWQLEALGLHPLIEKISAGGIAEGLIIKKKLLPIAVKQAIAQLVTEAKGK